MLKTFAYFARADGDGILIRSFMENDANDFTLLYQRDLSPASFGGRTFNKSLTLTAFAWRNLSFTSQITLPDGTVESFPTTVYKVIGNAATHREAAERWFAHINKNIIHFTGDGEYFANLFRPYSQTPYTPEPGYILLVGEGGSPSSTGLTVSAFRLLGLKAEHFLSPEMGYRTGAVEIDGEWYYHDGNSPLSRSILPLCAYFVTLHELETRDINPACLEQLKAVARK